LALSSLADESAEMGKAALLGFLHLSVPEHLGELPLGLCVHLMPSRASLSTYRQSLRGFNALPELFGIGCGAEP
jgi:hypothetical protein